MSLTKYEVFSTVVECGSLTKAAETLNLTQSAVSYSIANFESELGFPILNRSRSGVSLTSNGERILKYVRTILRWEEKMKQEAASINGLDTGNVRIGAFSSVCAQWMPGFLKRFKKEHPSIGIKVLEGGLKDIEQWIIDGVVDFGFLTLPTIDHFEIIPLMKDRMCCILPRNHPLNHQDKIRVEQLKEEAFIIQKSGYDNDIKRILKESGVQLKVEFEMADNRGIISMVENELGVSIIPELVIQGLKNNISIHDLDPITYRSIVIAVTSLKEISPAAKKFIENVQEQLK